jgi:hypothetical protein
MLAETPHADYSVTQSYGLCLAILAWVMQRIRTPEEHAQSPEARAAIEVKAELEAHSVETVPWNLLANDSRCSDFMSFSAFKFLKWLRVATCHGDARVVIPVNKEGKLIGFKFQMKIHGDNKHRTLILMETDLRRIGVGLAGIYCESLKGQGSFIDDAKSITEGGGIC